MKKQKPQLHAFGVLTVNTSFEIASFVHRPTRIYTRYGAQSPARLFMEGHKVLGILGKGYFRLCVEMHLCMCAAVIPGLLVKA